MFVLSYAIKLCLSLSCLLICSFSNAQSGSSRPYTVKAFLPDWNGCKVELKINGTTLHADTVSQDMYSYVDTISGVHQGLFQIKKGSVVIALPLFIEPGTIKVVDKGHNQLTVSGTATNDAYQNLLKQITTTALLRHGYDYEKVADYKRQLCIRFIKEHPTSLLSLQLLKYYSFWKDPYDALYATLYYSLDYSVKNTYLGRQMGAALAVEKETAIGTVIPNLSLPDTLNQVTPLYGKNQLTLVDFWASWCVPCRQQNRALVGLFNTYFSKGFTIVSVSLDNNKEKWLNAIRSDKMSWKQLSDLKGWESAAAKTFHITAVPMNLLLDSNGCILAKNLHVTALSNLLSQRLPLTDQ